MKRKAIRLRDFLYADVTKPEQKPSPIDPETTASIKQALIETGFFDEQQSKRRGRPRKQR